MKYANAKLIVRLPLLLIYRTHDINGLGDFGGFGEGYRNRWRCALPGRSRGSLVT